MTGHDQVQHINEEKVLIQKKYILISSKCEFIIIMK